jgi:hypothetical protein
MTGTVVPFTVVPSPDCPRSSCDPLATPLLQPFSVGAMATRPGCRFFPTRTPPLGPPYC